ncbi:MAG: EFR1 family ferrodoxin, partial [Eubacteriales bacterium]
LIPIASLLNEKTVRSNADTVGFVFPVHDFTLPIAVKQFIQKTDFSSAAYLFAMATREGTVFDGFEKMDKLLAGQNKKLNAHFIVNMPDNEAQKPGYALPTIEQFREMEQTVLQKLDSVQSIVDSKQDSREEDKGITNPAKYASTLDKCERKGGVQYFYADNQCVGCGLCRKICLSNKITMYGRKPVWEKKVLCSMCFACLNYCPRNAVQIKSEHGEKSESEKNVRYPHPYATAEDIRAQKTSV